MPGAEIEGRREQEVELLRCGTVFRRRAFARYL